MKERSLHSKDKITSALKEKGIVGWIQLLDYVRHLPYGRNASREDLLYVVLEGKGTCSSKHALIKEVANRNGILDVELIMVIYKMSQSNTLGIGAHLNDHNLEYVPEAHCHIRVKGNNLDLTSAQSDLARIKDDIIYEESITPAQVAEYKPNFHKNFMKDWLTKRKDIDLTLGEVWSIREMCINSLQSL